MVDAATASQRRRLGAVAAYGLSGRPQFFLHFPGSGGTSIHAFALSLYGRNSTRWNNGCHAEQFSWRAALRAQDRCNCSTAVTFKLDNFHVRSLNGPAVYRLPLGAITAAHLERAVAWLSTAAVVLPLANLSALPRLLGVDVAMPHEVTGAHSTRRDVDPDLRALLEVHNGLDIRLYEDAQALFERRMASLPRDNR